MGHVLEEGLLKISTVSRFTSLVFCDLKSLILTKAPLVTRLASGLKAALLESRRSSE